MQLYGGEPIGSGTYGCVFRPTLQCKRNTKKRSKKYISKLMKKADALDEYKEITAIKSRLKTIPNYSDYFLLRKISMCKPKKLRKMDFKDFDEKCKNTEFKQNEVNDSIRDFYIINMPFGGKTIKQYLLNLKSDHEFIQLNVHLIDLLLHGILPMNSKNVYHSDIKENNILAQTTSRGKNIQYLRLIDWGLSAVVSNWKKIPSNWKNRTLQFNSPFSLILFFPSFIKQYNAAIRDPKNSARSLVSSFLDYILGEWPGHYETILYFFKKVNGENNVDLNETIINYLVSVLEAFADPVTKEFLVLQYISRVYSKIVDIYGLLSVYFIVIDLVSQKENKSYEEEKFISYLQQFLSKYLFQPRIQEIDIPTLVKEMYHMNSFFKENISSTKSPILLSNETIKSNIFSLQPETLQTIYKHSRTNTSTNKIISNPSMKYHTRTVKRPRFL